MDDYSSSNQIPVLHLQDNISARTWIRHLIGSVLGDDDPVIRDFISVSGLCPILTLKPQKTESVPQMRLKEKGVRKPLTP
jgi:hypothetical protein